MARVELTVAGPERDALVAVDKLMKAVLPRGEMLMEDPAQVAAGYGRIALEFADLELPDALALVRSLLDQIPKGAELITID